jgi:hypothetical protein
MAGAAEAIARIDRFVCDVKDSQYGDGLHVFGRGEQGAAERHGLLAALAGRRVAAGPAGSPWRGRADVLPTGRNLYAIDPRAVPSRAAHAQGVVLAQELVRRHLQDHGDYPRTLVVDLWGSATMRTAGEDFAMALHLLGAAPVWDAGSERVTGVEILPLARLDHPRLDVTLRVSGLLRDAFPMLPVLFGQAVRALCGRDEPPEWNPLPGRRRPRVSMGRGRAAMARGSARWRNAMAPKAAVRRARPGWPLRRMRSMQPCRPMMAMACAPAWRRRKPLSMRRICPRPTCCSAPTMPRTRRGLQRRRPLPVVARRPRSITSTTAIPRGRWRGRWARNWPAWCAPARPIPAGSRA